MMQNGDTPQKNIIYSAMIKSRSSHQLLISSDAWQATEYDFLKCP